ncbi:MAG: membrane protein insertase YidC [Gammaproteobacteria bacterium]|nr:membrane protein insertase YidC [Gammaproteobacteria bacterium]
MDIRRVVLYGALALVGYFLWMNWQTDYPAAPASTTVAQTIAQPAATESRLLPTMNTTSSSDTILVAKVTQNVGQRVYVKTDVLSVAIDLKHGDIVNAQLLAYPETADPQSKPFTLLQDNPTLQYVAESNLVVVKNNQVATENVHLTAAAKDYELTPGQDKITVNLTGETASGLHVIKQFIFKRDSYLIDVTYQLDNRAAQSWTGYLNTQFLRSSPKEDKTSMFHMGSFTGASYSVPGQHRYRKLSFKDMSKNNLDVDSTGGWIAMQQHYFLSAWIPAPDAKQRFYTRAVNQDYTIGQVSSPLVVAPQQPQRITAQLYLGPEVTDTLKGIAPGLEMTMDYGWLWFISQALFSVMKIIFGFVGNWGWSIILVTCLLKLVFYRLQAVSFKSMAKMRRLQPKIAALRERYGDDKAKISQATMELYRQEKVNPLGGCLPILVQIPVFIALYWVLIESVELRHAPFMLWISDLSAPDPFHVLPIIMGLTMLIQQKLNPAPPDPMQAKIMMFLPVVFTILFLNFPAGLVLYWTVNNSLSILQQWYITRKFGDTPPPAKKSKK